MADLSKIKLPDGNTYNINATTVNKHTVGIDVPADAIFTDTTYSAGTGLSLSGTTFSVKTGYTTSGNNRKVQADSNGNLYVVQTDNNTTYSLTQDSSDGHKITLTPSSGTAQTVTIPDNNTTYTFAGGTNKFTVTPSGGTAQDVTITPSISNNITGSGTRTSGYIAKFSGTNTITNGPKIGTSTTTYLNEAGSWATPPDTKNTTGADNTTSKIFLVGPTEQTTSDGSARTYSDVNVYTTNGTLTSSKTDTKAIIARTGSGTAGSTSETTPKYTPTKWTFNSNITVANGEVYFIKIPEGGGTYGVWCSLNNGTNYYPVAISSSKGRFTTHYLKNTVIAITYESAGVCTCYPLAGGDTTSDVTGIFRVLNDYDANTTYSAMSSSELTTGTVTTSRVVRSDYLKAGINSLIDTKINALDVTTSGAGASKTLTALSETDGKISATFGNISITKSQVSDFAHSHGNIANDGTISSSAATLASGDYILVSDTSASGKIENGIALGSSTTTFLNNKGGWSTPVGTTYTGTGLITVNSSTHVISTSATDNTGTVTKVSTGAGLVGGDIETTGTIKCDLKSETKSTLAATAMGSTSSRQYAVGLDKNGDLSVNIPWTDTTYTGTSPISINSSTHVISLGTVPIANGGTNGTTKLAATNNLGALNWSVQGTALTNENIDTDLVAGNTYYCVDAPATVNLSGTFPTGIKRASGATSGGSGFKIVQLKGYVSTTQWDRQILISSNDLVYYRCKKSTTAWNDWEILNGVNPTAVNPTTATTYYPIFVTKPADDDPVVPQIPKYSSMDGYHFTIKSGTASAAGWCSFMIGNSIGTGTAGNMSGILSLKGSGSYYTDIKAGALTSSNTLTLPISTGTLALVSQIPTTASDIGALPDTTKYAGSSSVGGSATSAVKLDTATAGTLTKPCYFSGGKPAACTYELKSTVPENAVFTDTKVTAVGNHYTPSGGSAKTPTGDTDTDITNLSSGSGSQVISGVTIDAAGHITGLTSKKIRSVNTTYANGTGITIGTGNKINHSNSVTAQTTQAVYPIKIDAQGHISAYGTAVTILTLGNGASNAYYGDKGKTAYDHSQVTSGNPHNVTKSDVGLGNVGNFKAVSTVASQGLTTTEKSNARTNIGAGTVTSVTIKGGNGITVSDETAITGSGTRTITNSQQGIYNVIGTQTSSTAAWTGTLSAVSALYNGLTICYFLPYASVANTSVTLNLTLSDGTTTGAVACYLSTGRLTTHYAKGTNIIMTYYKKGSISIDGTATTAARWIAHADYNTNTNTWRGIYVNGTSKTGTSTGTGYVNYKSGNSITVSGTYTADTKTDITFSIPSTTAPSYTVTATSPKAWSMNNAGVLATRWGNVIQIVIRLEGSGASVAAGTDGFSGKISVSGGGYLPARPVTLMGYTGKTLLMGWLDTDGSLTVRANEATTVASGNGLWLTGMFITNTDTTG